jgi:hypothetical protein
MQLGRFQLDPQTHLPASSVDFSEDGQYFTLTDERGYSVWRTFPLELLRRRGKHSLIDGVYRESLIATHVSQI